MKFRDKLPDFWNNANSSTVSTPYTIADRDVIMFKGEGTATIDFTPDGVLDDGQGLAMSPKTLFEVTAKSGVVYFISSKDIALSDDAGVIWANSNRIAMSVGVIVGDGCILCEDTGSFSVKISFGSQGGSFLLGSDTQLKLVYEYGEWVLKS